MKGVALAQYWFDPDAQLAREQQEIKEVEAGRFSGKGHLGAYYALLTGRNTTWVKYHAIVDEQEALDYCREIAWLLGRAGLSTRTILDVGCGPGTITNAFTRVYTGCRVTGIDISAPAIQYASRTCQGCEFLNVAISPTTALGRQFDVVHCREWYPFVRTSEVDVHQDYLAFCTNHLRPGGSLVLSLANFQNSVISTIDQGLVNYQVFGLTPFKKSQLANRVLRHYLPMAVARVGSKVLYRVLNRTYAVNYIAVKQSV